jgi:hypothetical protein
MNELNNLFQPYNIQFYECDALNLVADDVLFNFNGTTEETLLTSIETPNVLNVYFFNTVTVNGNPLCGYSYLPPSADRVIISKNCNLDERILLHEIGHYFSLYHTHGKSNSVLTDELVNGSNCATAGDDVCDTPAEPNLNGYIVNCTYIGGPSDANGQQFQPDPTNLMSYAPIDCRTQFTTGQLDRMAYSVLNDRAYLVGCPHPNDCENQITLLPKTFDFETGFEDWANVRNWDNSSITIPFVVGSGATPTPNTGPDAAWSGNQYLYVEASVNPTSGRYAILRSPCFDLHGYAAPKMSFRYHSFGTSMYEIVAQVSTDGGYNWFELPQSLLYYVSPANLGNSWQYIECDLTAFNTAYNVQVRIACSMDAGEEGDFAVDDVRFYDATGGCALAVSPSIQDVNCQGNNDGQIYLGIAGSTGALTYSWSTGSTDNHLENLAPGTYVVTVTDALGCVGSAQATVQEPFALASTLTTTNVSIPGQSTGSISASTVGGTAPYYYSWSNGATTSSISGLAAGTYSVTIIDARDCQLVKSATVTQPTVTCSSYYNSFPWNGGLESNFGIFERVLGYPTNWVRRKNSTPNQQTGPDAAYQGDYYAHINSNNNQLTAVIRTKDCLDLTAVSNPVIEFYYHMFGSQMGTLYVEVSTDDGATWSTAWSLSGNQGNQWTKASVNLQPYNTGATRIRFRGVTGGLKSDMAIDALYIGSLGNNQNLPFSAATQDITTTDLLYPNPSNGVFQFETNGETCQVAEVLDAQGAVVWRAQAADVKYRIDLSQQPSGIYFLRYQTDTRAEVKKLMMQK